MSKAILNNSIQSHLPSLKSPASSVKGNKAEFEGFLKNQLESLKNKGQIGAETLSFSNHAVERMKLRGIQFSPDELSKISEGVNKAKAKGAKESLLLTDKAAMIVNIKNNKVVTVMDKANMKENVFTNIDSTILV